MEKWQGKTAIVTGASSGIGAAIVRDLSKAGINVIALARRVERLGELKQELIGAPGKVTPIKCDVSNKKSVEEAFEKIESDFGILNILVNNAGVLRDVNITDFDDPDAMEKIEQVIQTNLTGLIRVTRKAFQLIEKSDDYGLIVNVGSITGHGVPYMGLKFNAYPGTKHAVRATTEVIRQELVNKSNKKVRVSEISPGAVATEIQAAAGCDTPGDDWYKDRGFPALKDSDVSQAVNFLLMTDYSVNLTEIIIKPTGEQF